MLFTVNSVRGRDNGKAVEMMCKALQKLMSCTCNAVADHNTLQCVCIRSEETTVK